MDAYVFAAVLFAAACHAGWNAYIKIGVEPFMAVALIATGSAIIAIPLVPFVGLPPLAAAPWLIASVILHIGYYIGLTEAYRTGDMGQVYPIARGSAPLMTASASALLLGETLPALGWTGIVVLALGVFLMSFRGGRDLAKMDRRAVGFALFTAMTICGYSIVDGTGARVSGNPHAYAVSLFVWDGLAMVIMASLRRGADYPVQLLRQWKSAFIGGALSFAAYWIAIWAMTVAPIAIVAALRETSVLFAAAIAIIVLREPLRPVRIAAAFMIVCGLGLIRLS